MTEQLHLVGVGLEVSLAAALAEAIASRPARDVTWQVSEGGDVLEAADVVVVAARTPGVVSELSARLPDETDVVPLVALDDLSGARLAGFTGDGEQGRAALMAAAGALSRAGLPVPPELPALLRAAPDAAHLFPAEAGGLRAMALVLQCVAHPAPDNFALLVELLRSARALAPEPHRTPQRHPRHGFYHPDHGVVGSPIVADPLPGSRERGWGDTDPGLTVVAVARTAVCSGNDAHLHHLWQELTREGHQVVGWFGTTEDVTDDFGRLVDDIGIWINTRCYTLTGGDGSPELEPGVELLAGLDTIQLSTLVLTSQTRAEWEGSGVGIGPATIAHQVAIPELQGGVAPIVIATRAPDSDRLVPVEEHCSKLARLARRHRRLATLPATQRTLAVVVVAHDPDKGRIGTASMLDVWRSLWLWMGALRESGHSVEVPNCPEDLLAAVLAEPDGDGGPATSPRVLHAYHAAQYLADHDQVERVVAGRGPAPGEFDSDGVHLFVHGAQFGNVTVICQPSFGYGPDPATLLFDPDASPTHAFAATYVWIRQHLQPDAVLHFGTHGALEFMPGTQLGLTPYDFTDHLIGDVPHHYLYVASNPSEAAIAKRRSYATIVNHLNPPLARSDLYGELASLRTDLTTLLGATDPARRAELWSRVREQATGLGLDEDADPTAAEAGEGPPRTAYLTSLFALLDEVADSLIALGLHVLGQGIRPEQSTAILTAAAELGDEDRGLPSLLGDPGLPGLVAAVVDDTGPGTHDPHWYSFLAGLRDDLGHCPEITSLLAAQRGGYVRPGPGGDPVRHRDVLPTGRNTYSVDPLRIPTPRAVQRGRQQAEALLAHARTADGWPETVSVVMWGIDTIKTLGEAPAQAFALLGVEPCADANGEVTRLRVIPLAELGRPRMDVVITTSGVFRDMFGITMELLDRAVHLVARLEESDEDNYLRKHCRQTAAELGVTTDQAATRVFSSLHGRYGTGVNQLIDAGTWEDDSDLGEVYLRHQGHAYGRLEGREAVRLLRAALSRVDVAFQNIDGAEQSLADNDDYLAHLGGVTAAVVAATGGRRPRVLTADNYSARAKVRDLDEALRLEARTRMLNPKWHHAMLDHGYQGVHEVSSRLANTFGWAAATQQVDGWIFTAAARTFLFDEDLRERMVALNPAAVRAMADTLDEARDRALWQPDQDVSDQLDEVRDRLDDQLEGVA